MKNLKPFYWPLVSVFSISMAYGQGCCDKDMTLSSCKERLKKQIETGGGIPLGKNAITYQVDYLPQGKMQIRTMRAEKVMQTYVVDLTSARLGENVIIYHNPKSEPDEFTLKFKKSICQKAKADGALKPEELLVAGNNIDERVSDYLNYGNELEDAFYDLLCCLAEEG